MPTHALRITALMLLALPAIVAAQPATLRLGDANGSIVMDMQAVERLPQATIRTRTQWDRTPHDWRGVRVSALLDTAGRHSRALRVSALDDYVQTIPAEAIRRYEPVLAWLRDGRPLPVSDKGPFVLIWPYDTRPELAGLQVWHDRAVWQVSRLDRE